LEEILVFLLKTFIQSGILLDSGSVKTCLLGLLLIGPVSHLTRFEYQAGGRLGNIECGGCCSPTVRNNAQRWISRLGDR
jgi:hypothetical protein